MAATPFMSRRLETSDVAEGDVKAGSWLLLTALLTTAFSQANAEPQTAAESSRATETQPSMKLEEVKIRGELQKPKIFFIVPKRRSAEPYPSTLEPMSKDQLEASALPDPGSRVPETQSAPADWIAVGHDCRQALYETYFLVVSYARDHGHPPVTLLDLLGEYAARIPRDPRSGDPLRYQTDGGRFSLGCTG